MKFSIFIILRNLIINGGYYMAEKKRERGSNKSKRITEIQRHILEYMKTEIINRGYPPSIREICDEVGLRSTSSVHAHLETLDRKGYIRRDPAKPRAIEIVDDNFNAVRNEIVNVPVIGQVAAGYPILAIQNIESYFPLSAEYIPAGKELFILNVKGNSMIEIGIFDGDQVIVERCDSAENGDIAVVLLDDSATVKTFYKENGRYRLQPENSTMQPIYVDRVKVLGKVVSLFRPTVSHFNRISQGN